MTVSTSPRQTRIAIFAIITSVAALSLGDAVIKATDLSLPLWQMFILRSFLVVPVLLFLVWRRGRIDLSNIGWALLRSALLTCMWLSYYSALPLMPLSQTAAAYYTGPIFIVALASLIKRRMPSGPGVAAIAGGFFGVLLIVRPDATGIDAASLLPIIAAFLYACAMVLTSAKCAEDDPFVLALVLNVSFICCGAVLGLFAWRDGSFILGPWQTVDLLLLGTVTILAALILIGSVGAAIAYQKGPPSTVAAFDYSYLVFSLTWGALFFSEFPGTISLVGIGLIAGAGLMALGRHVG